MPDYASIQDKPPFDLREYQLRTIQAARTALRKHDSILITAPTGAGKTVMFSEMIRQAALKGFKCDIIVHREELINQSQQAVKTQTGVQPGIIWQTRRQWHNSIRIISHGAITGLEKLPDKAHHPDLLFLDEAHHSAAPGWLHAIRILNPRWLIGFTATPFRNDKTPLVPIPFQQVVREITPQELIDQGILVPPVVVNPIIADAEGFPQPINQAANLPDIYLNAVRYAIARGREKIIIFTSSNGDRTPSQVAYDTQQLLQDEGIQSGIISESSNPKERRRIVESFDKIPTATLINYMTLTEGFDSKCVDCVILGRQTKSESTLIQMIGRGLRQYPGKTDCLVLNFTGRPDIHNIINYWRLDGPKSPSEPSEKRAPKTSDKQLDQLTARFPNLLSAISNARIDYPWLSPYPKRRLRALRIWRPTKDANQQTDTDTYVCVEPTARQQWKVTRVKIPKSPSEQISAISRAGLSSQQTASAVAKLIGNAAQIMHRKAPWRRQPATDRQRHTWKVINQVDPPNNLTSGDASDAIALYKFQQRVNPALL